MISLELCEISLVFREIKTVFFTTTPQMHCAACENKIKNNLRFEKGIKSIETSVPNQTVTVKYNADKTTIPFF
ncbi:MAG: heavy-metal-associated domain-containing protein [Prevotella sp.]|jgi:periplasmic mercuric ion binding protein|uniref:Heavy-metal-associated domain-containing protein n=1 Tax=Segatella copri TaxID=165179 RepID=A0AAW5IL32_9BACT|nr:heavy metal-associated domain-containing protein [Segatella copri]MBD8993589.1 heavy-metal-associated domain-containing protein [Prevotella sp.]MBD8993853.1 heavy-metal-associated domain-containing protein [Prevotella sp.]MCP9534267.1 heavy-metal-associated domain-containing protein [Segatella copri]MCP9537721.1 heavy-metal-associated domain-containing protein [Segatella copri]MCP9539783.1 heavy-metal-associated domain-containing protein [Segatella copri]